MTTTGPGAPPALFIKATRQGTRDALVGFSTGLVLAVTTLNLIPEALGQNQEDFLQVVIGIAVGAFALFVADIYLPHIHGVLIPDKPLTKGTKATLMMVTAMIIHNLPEGFATGTAYSGGLTVIGNTVTLGISSQDSGFIKALRSKPPVGNKNRRTTPATGRSDRNHST